MAIYNNVIIKTTTIFQCSYLLIEAYTLQAGNMKSLCQIAESSKSLSLCPRVKNKPTFSQTRCGHSAQLSIQIEATLLQNDENAHDLITFSGSLALLLLSDMNEFVLFSASTLTDAVMRKTGLCEVGQILRHSSSTSTTLQGQIFPFYKSCWLILDMLYIRGETF